MVIDPWFLLKTKTIYDNMIKDISHVKSCDVVVIVRVKWERKVELKFPNHPLLTSLYKQKPMLMHKILFSLCSTQISILFLKTNLSFSLFLQNWIVPSKTQSSIFSFTLFVSYFQLWSSHFREIYIYIENSKEKEG